jgi:CRISPR-associated protein Cas2
VDDEHLYVVTYDIADQRRWRVVFKLMHGYGEWLQLSVFQCRLSRARHAELLAKLQGTIAAAEDHVMVIDVGIAENCEPRVQSLGKQTFAAIERKPIIV